MLASNGTTNSSGARRRAPAPNDTPELKVSSAQTAKIVQSSDRSIAPPSQLGKDLHPIPHAAKLNSKAHQTARTIESA